MKNNGNISKVAEAFDSVVFSLRDGRKIIAGILETMNGGNSFLIKRNSNRRKEILSWGQNAGDILNMSPIGIETSREEIRSALKQPVMIALRNGEIFEAGIIETLEDGNTLYIIRTYNHRTQILRFGYKGNEIAEVCPCCAKPSPTAPYRANGLDRYWKDVDYYNRKTETNRPYEFYNLHTLGKFSGISTVVPREEVMG